MVFRPDRATSQERRSERLAPLLAAVAAETNAELVQLGADAKVPLLHDDATLNMRAFLRKHGGPYGKETDIRPDEQFINEREREWSDADNPKVQAYHNVTTAEGVLDRWRADRAASNGAVLEMALTASLHRIIGPDFIVARASTYDDYANGIDTVIIDKATGDVVCTFDEVTDTSGGDRYAVKLEKVVKRAKQGGSSIRYGLGVASDAAGQRQVVKQSLEHVPLFYLSLDKQQRADLLAALPNDIHVPVTEVELKIFDQLADLLERQATWLQHEQGIPALIQERLTVFQGSLVKMRERRARSTA